MITVGEFLEIFVKYAKETPRALVYTDLAPWNSDYSAYCYIKSIMLDGGAVLLDCIIEERRDKYCFFDAETVLRYLQNQDPSLQLLVVDCNGETYHVDRAEVDEVLEYDSQDPKEVFFYTDTGFAEDDEDVFEDED